jgi:hypothetical protein
LPGFVRSTVATWCAPLLRLIVTRWPCFSVSTSSFGGAAASASARARRAAFSAAAFAMRSASCAHQRAASTGPRQSVSLCSQRSNTRSLTSPSTS